LFTLISDEVFVDCGSFDGDSIRSFYQKKQVFNGKIFAIEPDPQNIKKLEMYLTSLDKSFKDSVSIIPKVVGRKHEILRFSANGSASSVIDPEGIIEVECSPIDDINPTFIKMDIEGAELDALYGATKSIRNSLPILAISVYHLPDHLWRIPLFINSVTDQYHYFLRPHNEEGWDLVLYAIPNERLLKS
jgi:FkbM family methyltransferase